MTSAWVQLRALFGLRWQMIRTDGVRIALVLTGFGVAYLVYLIAHSADALEPAALQTATDLAPQAFLGFGALALIAPLTAGGGSEIVPPDQLVAFPVRPRTQFLGGLILTPINLVWVLQLLALVGETAFLSRDGHAAPAAVVTVLYVVAVTALGQVLAWTVVGLRRTRSGRQTVALAGAGLLLAALYTVRHRAAGDLLDHTPARSVVTGVRAGAAGRWAEWLQITSLLALAGVTALVLGGRACAWALRRPGDVGADRDARSVRRRKEHNSPLRTLVALDRASVWRAPALRRGALVLAVLPGLAAAGAQVPWQSLAVFPGLVASGAGLLFGINAFCLDGSGAVLLASLPHDPRLVAKSKVIVLTETVLAAVLIAAATGGLRSRGEPTATVLVAIIASGLACTAMVVSRGMASSVRHPHKAELRGPRDAVAPPGALTMASVRLALPTGLVAVVIGNATSLGVWWLPLVIAVPVITLCVLSLRRSMDSWADPLVRARIVQAVSSG